MSEAEPGYVSHVVLAETSWVLSRTYRADRRTIATAVEELLRAREIRVERPDVVYAALAAFLGGSAEFADALIAALARAAGCAEIVTLDRSAAAKAGMRLLA